MKFSVTTVLCLSFAIACESVTTTSSDQTSRLLKGMKNIKTAAPKKAVKNIKTAAPKKAVKEAKKSSKKSSKKSEPERRELCVIGGGAAGAYTAYEAQKRGYDTVLIEPQSNLGGNCEILNVPSVLDPTQNYDVNAAVVIFSPTDTVTSFFSEMGVETSGYAPTVSKFAYGTPYGTVPLPEEDQVEMTNALLEYSAVESSPPYAGVFENPLIPVPDFDILTEDQVALLLEPFGVFLQKHPGITPLVPVIAQLLQGFGPILAQPMYEILGIMPPRILAQFFAGGYLVLPNGCQEIYDTVEARMIAKDPSSVVLNTGVDRIARLDGKVMIDVTTPISSEEKLSYECDDAIIAFRPDGLDENILDPIQEEEKKFFSDLAHNGYVPSVWNLDVGPALQAVGVNPSLGMTFVNATIPDVGISTCLKDKPGAGHPWTVFYQPAEPANTPEKLVAVQEAIAAELMAIGFENPKNLFIKDHKYNVKPTTLESLKAWAPFFRDANYNDDDHLYWTGSVVSRDNTEQVWEYSKQLLDAKFPAK